jgi:hypothetical protein
MRVVLDMTQETGQIRGTAIWGARAEPVEFSGWLELVSVLETAQRDASDQVAGADG